MRIHDLVTPLHHIGAFLTLCGIGAYMLGWPTVSGWLFVFGCIAMAGSLIATFLTERSN